MKLNVHENNSADNIIDAAKSDMYKKVFFLGPYARRVNFSAQQNRVLNLIWALHRKRKIKPGSSIAIIGGGLSGLTACAALADLGYKVFLFESGREELHRQLNTLHRYIHPNIIMWPESPPHPTTQLPYFDWICGRCNELMRLLKDEWLLREKRDEIDSVTLCKVLEFHEADGQVSIQTKTNTEKNTDKLYSAVIVTSGFVDEKFAKNIKGVEPYWREDSLETDYISGNYGKFIVSGCGDGGLIDSLRIAHRHFNAGELPVKVASILSNESWKFIDKIKEAEAKYKDNKEFLSASVNGSKDLQTIYQKAAKKLPSSVIDILGCRNELTGSQSLRCSSKGLVTIISKEAFPFIPSAAPIHKLLFAHAMNNHVIVNKQGTMVRYKKDWLKYVPIGQDEKDENQWQKLKGRVVIRHGARPSFIKFLKHDPVACEKLIEKQRILAENYDAPFWKEGDRPLKAWPPSKPFKEDDLKMRYKHAAKIINKYDISATFGVDVNIGFSITYDPNCQGFENIPLLPDQLFGFPFEKYYTNQQKPEEAVAQGSPIKPLAVNIGNTSAGASIASAMDGRLGPIVKDNAGQYFALTVAHVLYSGAKEDALEVFNMKDKIIGTAEASTIAEAGVVNGENISLIRLLGSISLTSCYGKFSHIRGTIEPEDSFGCRVLLFSTDGGVRQGIVSANHAPVSFKHPSLKKPVVVPNAIRITPLNSSTEFSKRGDSGAPVVTEEGKIVGLVISGNKTSTFILPVSDFLKNAKLKIVSDEDKLSNEQKSIKVENANVEAIKNYSTIVWNLAKFKRDSQLQKSTDLGVIPEELDGTENFGDESDE